MVSSPKRSLCKAFYGEWTKKVIIYSFSYGEYTDTEKVIINVFPMGSTPKMSSSISFLWQVHPKSHHVLLSDGEYKGLER